MSKILGNLKKGLVFVISAPAGTGKTTVVDLLKKEFPEEIVQSCSCTTRAPRRGEVAKNHYHFLTLEEFKKGIQEEKFLEYAMVFGDYYGTLKSEVFELQSQGKHVVLVIDTQGALKLKDKIEAIYIFISPPSLDELKNRLLKRKSESEEKMLERLAWAQKEMDCVVHYDYHIINDTLAVTYQVIRSIFIAEEHKKLKEIIDVCKKSSHE